MNARCLLAALLVAVLLSACEKPPPVAPAGVESRLRQLDRPNIVLVLVDTLRANWLEPYGFELDISPELQRWADRGVVFERALAQSSWTKMSVASLLTSLWPRSHGIRLATEGLAESAVTLAEVLRDGGYRTYGIQSNGWLTQSFGFNQGFDSYVFPKGADQDPVLGNSSVWPHGDRILAEALRLVEAHDDADPFFLYLHFMDVHEYAAPPEFKTYGGDRVGSYRAAIRWADDILERLRGELERRGVAESTVMIFGSDHGETFGENRTTGHAYNVFTSVLHVPLLIRFPFATEPIRVRAQVRNLDIAPTVLDIVGLEAPEGFEGESLLPLIAAPEAGEDRRNFAALGGPVLQGAREQISVNDVSWSMARNLDGEEEEFLFELSLDPREDANLVELEPAAAERMRAVLDAHRAVEARPDTRASDVHIDPEIADRLRAVGYLQ